MLVVLLSAVPTRATAAPPYKPPKASLTCPKSASAGATVTVSGTGFTPNSQVALSFDASTPLGSATANTSGQFSTNVTIPANATNGRHGISATGPTPDGGTITGTCTVRIRGGGSPTQADLSGATPASSVSDGSSVSVPFVLGLATGLLLLGYVVVMRRRPRARR